MSNWDQPITRPAAIAKSAARTRTALGHVAATSPEHARCRVEARLTVSVSEQRVLEREDHRARRPLVWHPHPTLGPELVQLETAPCPFLYDGCWCAIYRQRPARCR